MATQDSNSAVRADPSRAYIRPNRDNGGGTSSEEAIHRRRKAAMVALLGAFEEGIEPLIPPGNQEAIRNFKRGCREKINGLAYEGIRAARALPGEAVSELAGDLAERLAFPTDTED